MRLFKYGIRSFWETTLGNWKENIVSLKKVGDLVSSTAFLCIAGVQCGICLALGANFALYFQNFPWICLIVIGGFTLFHSRSIWLIARNYYERGEFSTYKEFEAAASLLVTLFILGSVALVALSAIGAKLYHLWRA